MRGRWVVLLTVAATWPGQQVFGWGATSHECATGIAIEMLPVDIPAFVRDPAMLPELALMGRELDRQRVFVWRCCLTLSSAALPQGSVPYRGGGSAALSIGLRIDQPDAMATGRDFDLACAC